MKKALCISICFIMAVSMAGCFKNKDAAVTTDTESIVYPNTISDETSKKEVHNDISYPEETEEIDAENLRFKSSSGNIVATFPKIFCRKVEDAAVNEGIYLTTEDGKATLQLDHVISEEITRDKLKEYLEKQYKNSKAELIDENILIFRTINTDKKKNKAVTCLKAVVKDNSYTQVIVSYHESDSSLYESIIDKVEIK